MTAGRSARLGKRGRDSNMGEMQMGTCTFVFHDPDQELNLANPLSPFEGTLEVGRPACIGMIGEGLLPLDLLEPAMRPVPRRNR